MFNQLSRYLILVLISIAFGLVLMWGILEYYLPAPPQKVLVSVGLKNGPNEAYAKQYQAILARSGITLELHESSGSGENLERLNDPKSNYQIGFASEGASDSTQVKRLFSLGQVAYNPYWIFYRSAKEWTDLDSLKSKRVAIGAPGTGRYKVAKALNIGTNTPYEDMILGGMDAKKALLAGRLDAIFVTGVFTVPLIQDLLLDPSIRVLNFPRANTLTKLFPQLRHLVLSAGIVDFEKNIPPHDIDIIGNSISVLVREDLHPQITYLMAQAVEEVHSGPGFFHESGTFPTQTDIGYTMSSAARDYYKNGPSFLYRYLPFWVTNYIHRLLAILVAILGIVLPLIKILPKLYNWFIEQYTDKLFRRLRVLHIDIEKTRDLSVLKEMEKELNSIDRAAHLLPMRNTNLYFSLIGRVDNERRLMEKQLAL